MVRPTLIDFDSIEINYYSFMTSLDKCNGSCNVADELSTKICVLVDLTTIYNWYHLLSLCKTKAKTKNCIVILMYNGE